jgi:hypothetical protein
MATKAGFPPRCRLVGARTTNRTHYQTGRFKDEERALRGQEPVVRFARFDEFLHFGLVQCGQSGQATRITEWLGNPQGRG